MIFAGKQVYPHQESFLLDSLQKLDSGKHGDRYLYAGPTGSGKSLCELMLLEHLKNSFLITPRIEIIKEMLVKIRIPDVDKLSTQKLVELGYELRISTPVRFRNLLAKGEHKHKTDIIIVDESHHESADTYQEINAYLPRTQWVGLTATPFRGTPKGTKEFLDRWNNDITWIISVKRAVEQGYIKLPDCIMWPLLDDDEIEVVNGEFRTTSSENHQRSRMADLVERIKEMDWFPSDCTYAPGYYDKSTMIAVSTTDMVNDLVERLNTVGLPAMGVTQSTSRTDRNKIFELCENKQVILVQIDVVSEGVDLKIDRLIDYKPTMSPVRWKQQIGRIERPGGVKEYYCTNRNLERFAYLYEGMLPPAYISTAQQAFAAPTRRAGQRAFGLEDLGRFKPSKIEFKNSCVGELYTIFCINKREDGNIYKVEYAALVHPAHNILYAKKESLSKNGEKTFAPWVKINELPDLTGYQTSTKFPLTDKQLVKWKQLADYFGLDVSVTPNQRTIQALFLLRDTNHRV